jgi:hypothetical protein
MVNPAQVVLGLFFGAFTLLSAVLEVPVCIGEKVSPTSSNYFVQNSYDWGLKVAMAASSSHCQGRHDLGEAACLVQVCCVSSLLLLRPFLPLVFCWFVRWLVMDRLTSCCCLRDEALRWSRKPFPDRF